MEWIGTTTYSGPSNPAARRSSQPIRAVRVSNWNIYNNIFTQLDVSNGIFACINSGSRCTNINFYGNTLVTGSRTNPSLIYSENTGSTYTVRNTLAYNYNGLTIQGGPGSATVTQDHNTWLNSGSPGGGTGTITVTSGAPNPFVDYAGLDYRLASNNANWNNGTALASPFNMDAAGNARPGADGIWNTGALQFSATRGRKRQLASNWTHRSVISRVNFGWGG